MQRKKYNAVLKREAERLAVQPGQSKRQVAEELGVHENLLSTWVRKFAAGKWETVLRQHKANRCTKWKYRINDMPLIPSL